MNSPAAGWHPDPTGRHEYRYWDGTDWTGDVADQGTTAFDPIGGPPTPEAGPSPADAPTAIGDATGPFGPQPGGYGPEPTAGYGAQPGGYGPEATASFGPQPGGYGPQPGFGAGPGPGTYDPGPGDYHSGQFPPTPPAGRRSRSGIVAVLVGVIAVGLIIVGAGALALFGSDSDSDDGETADTTVPPDDATTTTATPSTTTATTAPPTTAGPRDENVFTLSVGDCLVEEGQEGEVREVPVVPCDQPHTSEVYYEHKIPGDTLPSESEMEDIVDAECVSRFEGFVGIPYPDSALLVTWLEPTPGSWAAGDRELLCLASGPPGEVVGTLEGSNR